jgi:hypothetical protein
MGKYSEVFVAFDVAKKKHAVAIAEGGRMGALARPRATPPPKPGVGADGRERPRCGPFFARSRGWPLRLVSDFACAKARTTAGSRWL